MTIEELDFLRESNNIEDEWDDKSLQDAILAWQYVRHQMILKTRHILTVHEILMNSRNTIEAKDKGVFRNGPVWVGNREGRPWYAISNLIEEWLHRINERVINYESFPDLEELIRNDHVAYETIHPFFDGNGRTGRIFYNWERKRCNLPIEVIWEKEKNKYYEWF